MHPSTAQSSNIADHLVDAIGRCSLNSIVLLSFSNDNPQNLYGIHAIVPRKKTDFIVLEYGLSQGDTVRATIGSMLDILQNQSRETGILTRRRVLNCLNPLEEVTLLTSKPMGDVLVLEMEIK